MALVRIRRQLGEDRAVHGPCSNGGFAIRQRGHTVIVKQIRSRGEDVLAILRSVDAIDGQAGAIAMSQGRAPWLWRLAVRGCIWHVGAGVAWDRRECWGHWMEQLRVTAWSPPSQSGRNGFETDEILSVAVTVVVAGLLLGCWRRCVHGGSKPLSCPGRHGACLAAGGGRIAGELVEHTYCRGLLDDSNEVKHCRGAR